MVDSERLKRMKDLGGEDEYKHTGHRMLCRTVTDGMAGDATLCVEWSSPSPVTDLALLGNTRTCLARRLVLTAPLGSLDWSEVLLLLPMTPVVLPSHFSMIPPLARDTAPGSPLPPPGPGVPSRVH
ncbi:unnamed protein product [Gadus morhua 'NCC']